MKNWMSYLTSAISAAILGALSLSQLACPPPTSSGDEKGALTLLLASGEVSSDSKFFKQTPIRIEEIESLRVTVFEINLEESGTAEFIDVFDGAFEIDLVDLVGVSEVIDTAQVPPGTYTGVELVVSSGTLILSANLDVTIEDVPLPNDGRLLIPVQFAVEENGESFLVLNLGDINLVELDDGTFELTPELTAEVTEDSIIAQAVGKIRGLDETTGSFTLTKGDSELAVNSALAIIFLPGDFDMPSGSIADLAEGAKTFVLGTLEVDGSLTANIIVILKFAGEDGGEGEDEEGSGSDILERKIEFPLLSTEIDPDASGEAEYKVRPDRTRLKIEVEDITSTNTVSFVIDGVLLDAVLELGDNKDDEGEDEFKLDSKKGDEVPVVTEDSVIEVVNADTLEVLLVSGEPTLEDEENDDDKAKVTINDFFFDPPVVTIKEGGEVRWRSVTETAHTVASGIGPDDPTAGDAWDIEFPALGGEAAIKIDEISMNTGSLSARIRIETESETVEIEDAPFRVVDGDAVFDYFSRDFFVSHDMTGMVVVISEHRGDDDDDGDDDGESLNRSGRHFHHDQVSVRR